MTTETLQQNLASLKIILNTQIAILTFTQILNTTMLLVGLVLLTIGIYYLTKHLSAYKQKIAATTLQTGENRQQDKKIKLEKNFYLSLCIAFVGGILIVFACTQFNNAFIQYCREEIYSFKLGIKTIENQLKQLGVSV